MKQLFYLTGIILIIFFQACRKDFVVENIDKKTLTVNAPGNDLVTNLNSLTFWWEPLDGAEKYNLQIVKPDFTRIAELVLDTNVTVTKFNFSLDPGTYQWRIKATNAGHSTAFQTFNLKVDSTSNLSEQLVSLSTPVNNAVTGSTVVTLSWKSLYSAKKYRVQVGGIATKDTTITRTSITLTLQAVKNATTEVSWNVMAVNDFSESQFNSVPFKFVIDLKGPTLPTLLSPGDAAINVNATDSLKWKHGADAYYDSLYIAEDSLFINLIQQLRTDQPFYEVSSLDLTNTGTFYWWKIRSFDAYGNASSYSSRRKFKLAP